jgi:hypothetical protein
MQVLDMSHMRYRAELLAPLQGLAGLRELTLRPVGTSAEGLGAVCQLTGLRRLDIYDPRGYNELLLLRLTQLRQLTALHFSGTVDMAHVDLKLSCQVSNRR